MHVLLVSASHLGLDDKLVEGLVNCCLDCATQLLRPPSSPHRLCWGQQPLAGQHSTQGSQHNSARQLQESLTSAHCAGLVTTVLLALGCCRFGRLAAAAVQRYSIWSPAQDGSKKAHIHQARRQFNAHPVLCSLCACILTLASWGRGGPGTARLESLQAVGWLRALATASPACGGESGLPHHCYRHKLSFLAVCVWGGRD